jgi:hypothetical protein
MQSASGPSEPAKGKAMLLPAMTGLERPNPANAAAGSPFNQGTPQHRLSTESLKSFVLQSFRELNSTSVPALQLQV